MKNRWNRIVNLILEQAKGIHQWGSISDGWIYLTDRKGQRYRITAQSSVPYVRRVIQRIKEINSF